MRKALIELQIFFTIIGCILAVITAPFWVFPWGLFHGYKEMREVLKRGDHKKLEGNK